MMLTQANPPHYSQVADQVVDLWGPVCHLCRKPIDMALRNGPGSFQVDHVWPQSRGGCDHLRNLRPSHRRCNGSRGNKLLPWARTSPCLCTRPRLDGQPRKRTRLAPKVKPHGWRRFWGHALLWTLGLNPVVVLLTIYFPPIAIATVPLFLAVLALCKVIWDVGHPYRQGTIFERD
jgi:hypothetical protein